MGRPIDARGWVFEVRDQSRAHRERWLPIENLTSWSHNASENEETAETTSFDSKGWFEQDVMQRGGVIEIEGQWALDTHTGQQAEGQAYVDQFWAQRLGIDSRNEIRYRHDSQDLWVIWEATVTPDEQSGETNDKTSWSASFTQCGRPRYEPVFPHCKERD
ncbi:phage tail tube protein [Streptomyces sp. NPDC057301]|uniref:phage tail tube protein n=1 Tax=Streptomyces sp. NPDC057301 TaxID=3346093 RepID=UPI0036310135